MQIRRAEPKDYAAYCSLVAEVDELHNAKVPRYFRKPDPPRSKDYYSQTLSDPLHAIFVAEQEGLLLGYIHLKELPLIDKPIQHPLKTVQVSDVVVAKAQQRQGIGKALIGQGRQWALGRGAAELQLSVWDFNDSALRAYESAGFFTKYRTMALPLDKA